MDITKLDKNMLGDGFEEEGLIFYPASTHPIKAFGIKASGEGFIRVDREIAAGINGGVSAMTNHLAGGRFIFKTNATKLAVKFRIPWDGVKVFNQANAGFDVYVRENGKQTLLHTYRPQEIDKDRYIKISRDLGEKKERELVINFPMRSGVKELYIGLDENATLSAPTDYTVTKPVVFYGSSITMGLCVSRPGCTYEAIMSQTLDFDFVNLGFGGGAKGEKAMAEYIAGLEMSAFVLDYDHNSPNPTHLKETQWEFYKTVRKSNPDTPIIMMSRPKYYLSDGEEERKAAIKDNYEKGIAEGDKNLYFIPGDTLMNELVRDCGTVDGIHPTDAGFFSMASVIMPLIKKLLAL